MNKTLAGYNQVKNLCLCAHSLYKKLSFFKFPIFLLKPSRYSIDSSLYLHSIQNANSISLKTNTMNDLIEKSPDKQMGLNERITFRNFPGLQLRIMFLFLLLFSTGHSFYPMNVNATTYHVNQQAQTLKGKVVDSLGDPLPGATIQQKGSTKGVITDIDGNFEFTGCKPGDILVISYIGMETKEVKFQGERQLIITLKDKTDELDEVTVVAFAKQKKESVVASITTVKPSELKVPSSNLTTALAGRVAGLISYQQSGEPGQDNANFFIRGITTFGADAKKDPLILIDGIELNSDDLARLNTDDIASFSIMKDATATALYGARGANGVILVTTKEGKEGKVTVNARVENTFTRPTERRKIADPVTYMRMQNEAIKTRDPMGLALYSEEKIAMTAAGRYPNLFPAINWYDTMLKDMTVNQRANVSLSGGGKLARYYVAGNVSHDTGNIRVDKRNNYNNNIKLIKYSFRSNINIDLTKTTELFLKMSASFDDYNGPIDGGTEVYRMAMQANPVLFQPYYTPDNQYVSVNHILYGNYGAGSYVNPYAQVQRGYKEYSKNTILAQLGFKQNLDVITKGLSARVLVNIDRYAETSATRAWNPYFYGVSSYNLNEGSYRLKRLRTGSDGLDFNQGKMYINTAFYLEGTLEYSRLFKEKHHTNALFVYTMREAKESNPDIKTLQLSLPNRNIGFAGRLAYNYDNRYMIEGNFGYNGSERFSKNNRWGFFPSIGLGWMLSNEKFFQPLSSFFNQFKLKATYGMAGNDQIGNNDDRFYYMSEVKNNEDKAVNWGERLDYSPGGGFYVNRYANDQIGWEKSYKLNAGVEFSTTFGLNANIEYFHEKRENILLSRTIPATTGITQDVKANLGKAKGSGFDIELNYEKFFNKDLWLTSRGTFTYAASKVLKWEEPDYSETPWVSAVNKTIGRVAGYIAERLFIDEEEVRNSPTQFGDYTAGDIKYRDINRDGKINELDKVTLGYPNTPQIMYGFGFSLGYKGIDISCFFQGSARQSFMLDLADITPFHNIRGDGLIGQNAVLQAIADNYWSESNPNPYAFWPRLQNGMNENNKQESTWWLQDASYLRLKSVELGYTLPQALTRKLKISNLRLYVSGTNLVRWSKFKLWDPEMGKNGLNYPIQQVFNVGLNVGF